MNIEINHEDIAKAIQDSATKAIADRMGGHGVREAIAATITDDLATGIMADSIRKALDEVDTGALTTALAREIQRAMAATVVNLLEDAAIEMVAKLRGIAEYDSKRDEKLAALRVKMFGRHGAPEVV